MLEFVLDHNFPVQSTGLDWPPRLNLTSLWDYDRRLTRDHDDWQVITDLSHRGNVDGYITNDDKILNLPTEVVALNQTSLIFVVTSEVGNDPLAAMGLLMAHLPAIARREESIGSSSGRARLTIYRLRPLDLGRQMERYAELIRRIASNQRIHEPKLVAEELATIRSWPGLP